MSGFGRLPRPFASDEGVQDRHCLSLRSVISKRIHWGYRISLMLYCPAAIRYWYFHAASFGREQCRRRRRVKRGCCRLYVGVISVECKFRCCRPCIVTVIVGASRRVAIGVDVVGAGLVVAVGVESKCDHVPSCVVFGNHFPAPTGC